MGSTAEEERDRRLRGARIAGVLTLVVAAAVVVATLLLIADGRSGLWLLLVDLLAVFVAVRAALRLASIGRALRGED